MNVIFHRITSYTWHFQNFTCVITILLKFDIHFLGLPWEIFFGVTADDLLHLKPLKNVKKNAIFFKLFWYKVFVHWKSKLLNFLVDMFRLVSDGHHCAPRRDTNMASLYKALWNWVKRFFEFLAYELSHRPDSWRGFLYIYLLSFPGFWTFCINWFAVK